MSSSLSNNKNIVSPNSMKASEVAPPAASARSNDALPKDELKVHVVLDEMSVATVEALYDITKKVVIVQDEDNGDKTEKPGVMVAGDVQEMLLRLNERVNMLEEDNRQVQEDHRQLQAVVDQHSTDIAELRQNINAGFEQTMTVINARFEQLGESIQHQFEHPLKGPNRFDQDVTNAFDQKEALKDGVSRSVKNKDEEIRGDIDALRTSIIENLPRPADNA